MTADAPGDPVRLILTGGNAHDVSQTEAPIRDLPAGRVIADKGYASDAFVHTIESAGAKAVIPSRKNRLVPRDLDAHLSNGAEPSGAAVRATQAMPPGGDPIREDGP